MLSANGTKHVSKEDLQLIETNGLCVIDCSWARIEEIKLSFAHERILPHMVINLIEKYFLRLQLIQLIMGKSLSFHVLRHLLQLCV